MIVSLLCCGESAWIGYTVGRSEVTLPEQKFCPIPKTEPERCLAYWFGTNDKTALRQRVCGKDSRDAPRK